MKFINLLDIENFNNIFSIDVYENMKKDMLGYYNSNYENLSQDIHIKVNQQKSTISKYIYENIKNNSDIKDKIKLSLALNVFDNIIKFPILELVEKGQLIENFNFFIKKIELLNSKIIEDNLYIISNGLIYNINKNYESKQEIINFIHNYEKVNPKSMIDNKKLELEKLNNNIKKLEEIFLDIEKEINKTEFINFWIKNKNKRILETIKHYEIIDFLNFTKNAEDLESKNILLNKLESIHRRYKNQNNNFEYKHYLLCLEKENLNIKVNSLSNQNGNRDKYWIRTYLSNYLEEMGTEIKKEQNNINYSIDLELLKKHLYIYKNKCLLENSKDLLSEDFFTKTYSMLHEKIEKNNLAKDKQINFKFNATNLLVEFNLLKKEYLKLGEDATVIIKKNKI